MLLEPPLPGLWIAFASGEEGVKDGCSGLSVTVGVLSDVVTTALTVSVAIAVVIATWYVTILLHEVGHVAAALAVGIPIRSVEVGTRKQLATIQICGVPWTFRLLPSRGVTRIGSPSSRVRYFVFAAGGLTMNLLLACLGWLLLSSVGWVAGTVLLINAVLFMENVLPFPARPPGRPLARDGWVLLVIAFRPRKLSQVRQMPVKGLADNVKQWRQTETK